MRSTRIAGGAPTIALAKSGSSLADGVARSCHCSKGCGSDAAGALHADPPVRFQAISRGTLDAPPKEMPSSVEVLTRLTTAANQFVGLAIAWHVVILGAGLAIVAGVLRTTPRSSALALTAPLFSVSLVAWLTGNPFNGFVFGAFATALALLSSKQTVDAPGALLVRALGLGVLVFGLVYPHFVEAGSALVYLYAAPTGVVPCPTLSAVIGLTLLGGVGSRAYRTTLSVLGLLYGLMGVLWLRVGIDVVLLAASVALLVLARSGRSASADGRAARVVSLDGRW